MGADMMHYVAGMNRSNAERRRRNEKKIMEFLLATKAKFEGDLMPWTLSDFRHNVCLMRSELDELLDDLEKMATVR